MQVNMGKGSGWVVLEMKGKVCWDGHLLLILWDSEKIDIYIDKKTEKQKVIEENESLPWGLLAVSVEAPCGPP